MEHAEAVKLIKDYGFAVLKHQNNWLGEAYESLLRALLSASIADTAGAKAVEQQLRYALNSLQRIAGGEESPAKFAEMSVKHIAAGHGKMPCYTCGAEILRTRNEIAVLESRGIQCAAPPAPSVADAAGASECPLSDEWIEMYALRHIAPHASGFKKAFGLDVPYQQTEQFERVKAYTQSVCAAIAKESRMEALLEARHVVYMALSLNDAFKSIDALVDKEPK